MIILHTVYNTLFFLLGVVLGVWKNIFIKTSDRWIDRLIAILKIGRKRMWCVFVCLCAWYTVYVHVQNHTILRWNETWTISDGFAPETLCRRMMLGERPRLIARRCRKLVSSLDVRRDVLITTAPKNGLIDHYTCRNLQSYRYSHSIVGYWV